MSEKKTNKYPQIEAIYDSVSEVISGLRDFVIVHKRTPYGYFPKNKVEANYGFGVYDLQIEKEIVPTKYLSIEIINGKYAYAMVERSVLYNHDKKGRIDLIDLECGIVEDNLIPIEGKQLLLKELKDDSGKPLYGLMNFEMRYIIDPLYVHIHFDNNGYIVTYDDNGTANLIDENGFVYAKYNWKEKVLIKFQNGLLFFEKRNESDIEKNNGNMAFYHIGIENLNGDIIFPYIKCDNLDLNLLPNGYVTAQVNGCYHLYNSRGEEVSLFLYDGRDVKYTRCKLYPDFILMQEEYLHATIYDFYGNILIEKYYTNERIHDIVEIKDTPKKGEYYMICYVTESYGYEGNSYCHTCEIINKYGQIVVPHGNYVNYDAQKKEFIRDVNYDSLCQKKRYSLSGSILVKSGTKDIHIPPIYQYVSDFQGEYAMILKDWHWGMINSKLEEVMPCVCSKRISFNEDGIAVARLHSSGLYGMINADGTLLMPFQYNCITLLKKGYYVVNPTQTSRVGVVNNKGEWVIPAIYDAIGYTKWMRKKGLLCIFDNIIPVIKENKYGYINYSGEVIIDIKFDYIYPIDEILYFKESETPDWTIAKLNGLWGFIDKAGHEVISCKFNSIKPFHFGLAAVKLNDFWGFIDKTGEIVIPCEFDSVSSFEERSTYKNGTFSEVKDVVSNATWMDEKLIINLQGDIVSRYDQQSDEEYNYQSDYDDTPRIYDNPHYNDNLDVDQQSADFWNSL